MISILLVGSLTRFLAFSEPSLFPVMLARLFSIRQMVLGSIR